MERIFFILAAMSSSPQGTEFRSSVGLNLVPLNIVLAQSHSRAASIPLLNVGLEPVAVKDAARGAEMPQAL